MRQVGAERRGSPQQLLVQPAHRLEDMVIACRGGGRASSRSGGAGGRGRRRRSGRWPGRGPVVAVLGEVLDRRLTDPGPRREVIGPRVMAPRHRQMADRCHQDVVMLPDVPTSEGEPTEEGSPRPSGTMIPLASQWGRGRRRGHLVEDRGVEYPVVGRSDAADDNDEQRPAQISVDDRRGGPWGQAEGQHTDAQDHDGRRDQVDAGTEQGGESHARRDWRPPARRSTRPTGRSPRVRPPPPAVDPRATGPGRPVGRAGGRAGPWTPHLEPP